MKSEKYLFEVYLNRKMTDSGVVVYECFKPDFGSSLISVSNGRKKSIVREGSFIWAKQAKDGSWIRCSEPR